MRRMVNDARSARKLKDEADDHNLKNNRKDSSVPSPDSSGVRRSSRETSISRQMTPSPQSTRKSKRLEKGMPPLTPPVKRKSERLQKFNTQSPLKKSDRGKKILSSGSSGSRQSAKRPTLSELKSKKEKSLIQVTMESEKAELSKKRKKFNSNAFRGLLKKQCINKIVPGFDGELEGPDKLSCVSSDNTRERMSQNCSSSGNMDSPESESSTCLARSRDGSVNSESVEETTTSTSASRSCSFLGTCVLCSKQKRIRHDSPEKELCSCYHTGDEDLGSFSTGKDRSDHGAALEFGDVCAACNKDGELLSCVGKGCKRCYHLCCLDPPLTDILPGVWHCPQCVQKKILFGVHSVSKGVESIWDAREVEVSKVKGIRQRQYFVKYHGLAHVHNLWVPEEQILLENPSIVSNYNAKDQTVRWTAEWTVPHRLLRRRPIQEKIFVASSTDITVFNYEWLVKWQGLNYDQATWELDSANFLSSSVGHKVIKEFEARREKATQEVNKHEKGSIIKLSELQCCPSPVNDNCILENVNKLRECWSKYQNAVAFDNQERALTVAYSIGSMIESSGPFLIIAASSSLSQWEAEFARLVPSVDVVVYNGNRETRKGIRASEFYEEGGRVLLQVLLSSPEAGFEDLDILRSIKWEAVVVDGYQHSVMSKDLEQIKMLSTDSSILLVIGQIKETTSEYVKILSLLDSDGDFHKLKGSKSETNDNLCKLKDRLSRFVAYGSISQVSKFIEYWVPVQISNYQLENYCATLLSNSVLLGSCSRNDPVGALRKTLHSVRKCCNHPYLLDLSVQERLIAELRPAPEILDIGIKASGKLQLLDMMLTEIKTFGLQVLVLFQLMIGSKGMSTGNILDDFLRQRFGPNTYERVDAGVLPSKKQAASNRFNKKENGQFVFLLENRACSSAIKLSSVDIVIIYDSDWNPAIDLRALQKISIESKVEQIKLFRLYSSCTVEERALVLAKKNLNLENNLQTLSRATSDSLLTWGASYLFSKLDEYHGDNNSAFDLNSSSGESLSKEVMREFQGILSEGCEKTCFNSVISKVKLGVGSYSANIPMLGEAKVQLKDGEEPSVFWKNLLDGKNPPWKYLSGPSPRNRKRVHYLEESPSKGEDGNDDMAKKRKKVVHENLDQVELGVQLETQVVSSYEKMQGEITRLCQILELSDNVTHTATKFLEYVIKNHHVNSDSPAIVQAFQISLCWISGSVSKHKIDKKNSLMLAKQLLNYQCTEEQASSVYSRMRSLKRIYLQSSDNTIRDEPTNVNKDGSQFSSSKQENAKMEIPEKTSNGDKLCSKDEAAESEISSLIKKIHKRNSKRMKKLIRKQQEEIQEFERICEEKKKNLESDYKLESAVVRSLHGQGSQRMDKLKVLDDKFAKNMEEHNLLKDVQLKDLEAKQLAARDQERERADQLLAEAKARSSKLTPVNAGDAQTSSCNDDVAPPVESRSAQAEGLGCEMITVNSENSGEENVKGNLPDTLVDNRDGPEVEANMELPSPIQSMVHSEQTVALQDFCDLLTQQVRAEIHHQNVVSTELQDRYPPSVENQNTSQIETPPLGLVTSVNPVPSNPEAPVTDDIIISVQFNNEPPVTDNSEMLQPLSANVSLSCDPSPAIEVDHQIHGQVRNFSQTAEQSISQCGEGLELDGNNCVTVPGSRVAQLSNQAELPNQALMQLRVDMDHLNGASYLPVHPTHPATSRNPSPSLFPDPLQTELERMHKETEQLERSLGDTVSKLKSDCEKEIQEIVAQIRKKYEARLHDTETEFRLKRNELDKNQSKLLMNKILAEAFRCKCLDIRPTGRPGVSSSFMQQLHQLSTPPPTRAHPRTPTLPPHQNSTPAQTMQQQLSRSHSMRPSPVTNQSASGPPVQAVRDAADLFPSPSRPPLISAITPTPNPTRLGSEIRSAAPHLQPFRPTSSTHSATSAPHFQSRPHSQPVVLQPPPPLPPRPLAPLAPPPLSRTPSSNFVSQPVVLQPPPPPPLPRPLQPPLPPLPPSRVPSSNFVSQNRAEPQSGTPSPSTPNLSSLELVMEMDRQALMRENRAALPLPLIYSNFHTLETLGNVQGNQTSSAIATDVVCLSDDE